MTTHPEPIKDNDRLALSMRDALLENEGIRKDPHLDRSVGLFDGDGELIATGSCFKNTLRCLAVRSDHRGEGLMAAIVSDLMRVQAERGNAHVFLYTKPETAWQFSVDIM